MQNNIKNKLLTQTDSLLEYLGSLDIEPSTPFTEAEVENIIAAEAAQAEANYNRAVSQFQESNADSRSPQTRRFVVYWGYPGAGKSFMAQKLIERFGREEDCLPFNIIDKDQHRDLFPNLFNHLKNGHLDECEKFAGITIDYVRRILDLSLLRGERSILSIGGRVVRKMVAYSAPHGFLPRKGGSSTIFSPANLCTSRTSQSACGFKSPCCARRRSTERVSAEAKSRGRTAGIRSIQPGAG